MNKKLKNVCLRSVDDGSVKYIIDQLSNLEELYPGHTNFTLRLLIYGDRPETDKEYQDRIEQEKQSKDYERVRELEQLKILKMKYPEEFK